MSVIDVFLLRPPAAPDRWHLATTSPEVVDRLVRDKGWRAVRLGLADARLPTVDLGIVDLAPGVEDQLPDLEVR